MADNTQSSPPWPSDPALQALTEGPDRETIQVEVPTANSMTEDCNWRFDLIGVSYVVVRYVSDTCKSAWTGLCQ